MHSNINALCELGLAMEMQGLQLQQELLQVGGLYW